MRIAAAQTHTAWGDRTKTADTVTRWIGAAAENGVELLAFPLTVDRRRLNAADFRD